MDCYFCGLPWQFDVPFVAVYESFIVKEIKDEDQVDFIRHKVACPRCAPNAPIITLTEDMKWLKRMDDIRKGKEGS